MSIFKVCDGKLKVLNEKKDALQLLSGHTDHCIEFVQSALDKGSDSAVLYSKKTLSRHLQKVKCQRADIPNPEIPVRIQIQLNQVQELQKVISQLGTIVVDGKPYPPPPNTTPPGGPGGNPGGNGSVGGIGGVPPNRQQQQPSPNLIPPMQRSGIPPGMSPMQSNTPGGFSNGPQMYNTPAQQQPPPFPLNRTFSQEGPSNNFPHRFPNMGPHQMTRQGQPHVSSSTHPQSMGIQ